MVAIGHAADDRPSTGSGGHDGTEEATRTNRREAWDLFTDDEFGGFV
jgi:hypothetical protein